VWDASSKTLTFPNPSNLKFIPAISEYKTTPYITTIYWINDIGPDFIGVNQNALDTRGETAYPTDFTAIIVSI
jgi:hypothetical protein